MHYFGNPRHTQSIIAYIILTEYFGNSSEKLHYGNVINMHVNNIPYMPYMPYYIAVVLPPILDDYVL